MAKSRSDLEPTTLTVDAGSRLKLSASLLKELGWDTQKTDFDCVAVYAGPGECWCAPAWLGRPEGAEASEDEDVLAYHPFADVLRVAKQVKEASLPEGVAEMPSVDTLMVPYRVKWFKVSPTKSQVNFPIGADMLRLILGSLKVEKGLKFRGIVHNGILVLLSPARVAENRKSHLRDTLGKD